MFQLFFKRNAVIAVAAILLILIIINAGLVIYNNQVIARNNILQKETAAVLKISDAIFSDIIRGATVSVRGFALVKEEKLLSPFIAGLAKREKFFGELDSLLDKHGYDRKSLNELNIATKAYQEYCAQMINLVRKDNMEEFGQLLREDRGRDLWLIYDKFNIGLKNFEQGLNEQAEKEYQAAVFQTILFQVLSVLFGVPTLLFMISRLRSEQKIRAELFNELEQNNRKYLFDSSDESTELDERMIIDRSILNFRKAAVFIKQISEENYEVDWNSITNNGTDNNHQTLANELSAMRDRLKQLKQEDEKRRWATEGITQFTEIVRKHQQDLDILTHQVVSFLVKYMNAQQGSLFVLQEESGEKILDLAACYAFDRKKHIQKQIAIGQGLVGQAYREAETTLLTQIPQGYTTITSGLGDSTPDCLVVVPMKHNNKVEAVLELAGFQKYELYQVAFLEKLGEIIASTVTTVRTNGRMQHLLQDSQMQAEQMRAQEEEMRQNMEELMATQEQQVRLERELRENAEVLQQQLAELQGSKSVLEQKEAELRAANEKAGKRSQQYREKMEALDADIENKTSQINVLKRTNEELLQKLAEYEAKDKQ